MTDTQRKADSRSTSTRGKGQGAQAFNEAGGAPNGQEKRLTKAEVLAMVKARIPMQGGTGNEFTTRDGEHMVPTKNQKKMMREFATKDITMTTGKAGTGKTLWACLVALQALASDTHNGIVINAPAVDAGEDIGFRPGNTNDKMLSYVNQIYENFDEWVGEDIRTKMVESKLIEVVPNADMRGRSFKKKMIIFDESQNASGKSLMTSLGRLGAGSNMIYLGDDNQNDRTEGPSAYVAFMHRFAKNPVYQQPVPEKKIRGMAPVEMTNEDIKRHPLLQMIAENKDDRPLEGHNNHRQHKKISQAQRDAAGGASAAPAAPANDTAVAAATVVPSGPKPA